MKKIIALILTVCLAATCIVLPAIAIDDDESIIPVRNPAVYTNVGVFPSLGMFLYNGRLTPANMRSFFRTVLNMLVAPFGGNRFVTGISLPNGTFQIPLGQEFELEATLLPTSTRNSGIAFMLRDYGVNWSVDDPSVCSVNGGKIIPVSEGKTTVYATSNDGGFVDSVTIIVKAPAEIPTENPTETTSEIPTKIPASTTYEY